ncbi:MAG: hypothetical protein WAL80_22655 [Xanthobacteraceae bacterium]
MKRTTMNWQGAVVKKFSPKLNAKAVALAALVSVSAGGFALAADMPMKAPPPPKAVPFFFVNDTSVSFTWFPTATNPGVDGSSGSVAGGVFGQKNTFSRYSGSIDHFDVWEYGTNLIHVEANQYGPQDPNGGIPGTVGHRELFAIARSTLGFNELTHSKMFASPLFTDIGLTVGGNFGINDDFLASDTTVGVYGLSFNLNLPGTVIFGIFADKEFSHSSFASCGNLGFGVANPAAGVGGGPCVGGGAFSGDRDFEWTWKVEGVVTEPLKFLPESLPVTFIDLIGVEGPKGTGISNANLIALGPSAAGGPGPATAQNQLNDAETKVEVRNTAELRFDTGKMFWGKPGIWDSYVGYLYWYNKFGTDHNAILFSQASPGSSVESSVYVGTTYHFK